MIDDRTQTAISCRVDLWDAALSARSAMFKVTCRAQMYLRLGLIELEGPNGVLEALGVDLEGWNALVASAEERKAAGLSWGAAQTAERERVVELERQLGLKEVRGGCDD